MDNRTKGGHTCGRCGCGGRKAIFGQCWRIASASGREKFTRPHVVLNGFSHFCCYTSTKVTYRHGSMMSHVMVRILLVALIFAIPSVSLINIAAGSDSRYKREEEFAFARKVVRDAAKLGMSIKKPLYRGLILESVAVSQAKIGDMTGALQTAAHIPDAADRVIAIGDIALIQTALGQKSPGARTFRQAHARIVEVKDKHKRALVLGKIGELEVRSRNGDAKQSFMEAMRLTTGLSVEDKPSTLFYLGWYQFSAAQEDVAETLREASRALALISDNSKKWLTAFQLAPLQVRVGDSLGALSTAHLCVDEAAAPFRSHVLKSIAATQADQGLITEALQTSSDIADEIDREEARGAIIRANVVKGNIDEATRLTDTIVHAWITKVLSLIRIAAFHSTIGGIDEANQRFTQALKVFEKGVSDAPTTSDFRLLAIVSDLIDANQIERATTAAKMIQFSHMKALALSTVADAWSEAENRETARSLLAQAEESATNGVSLERVARSYAGLGDIQTALDLAKKIQNEFDRAYAYQTIADIQAQSGEAKDVAAWAAELRSPYLKSSALLGIAYGILQRHGIDVRKSVL